MPYVTYVGGQNKFVSSLVFVCGTLFCNVNFETMCELCRHSWLSNICVYGPYLCCKGNKFYILCWAVYVSMCVHLAISSNFRILGTHRCVHLPIACDYICLVMFDFAKHMENFWRKALFGLGWKSFHVNFLPLWPLIRGIKWSLITKQSP